MRVKKSERVTVRIEDDLRVLIRRICDQSKLSEGAVIRRLVRDSLIRGDVLRSAGAK